MNHDDQTITSVGRRSIPCINQEPASASKLSLPSVAIKNCTNQLFCRDIKQTKIDLLLREGGHYQLKELALPRPSPGLGGGIYGFPAGRRPPIAKE